MNVVIVTCFCIVIFVACSELVPRIRISLEQCKRMKIHNKLEAKCKGCMHFYHDYENMGHCDITERLRICTPDKHQCYRES